MDIPEGLKYLEADLIQKRNKCFRPNDKDDRNGGWCSPVGCICYTEEEYALDLLKDMVNALEFYANKSGAGSGVIARKALKKYKEWRPLR